MATRPFDSNYICYYPHTSMYFRRDGTIVVCCYSKETLGNWPKDKLIDIWNGVRMQHLRKSMNVCSLNLDGNCRLCKTLLNDRYFDGILMNGADKFHGELNPSELATNVIDHPLSFNFELSNMCNFECITCGESWSSSIRKNREGLQPISNPYTPHFCEELKQFYPELRIANFLGGEPFLSPLYPTIWEDIININPKIIICAQQRTVAS